MKDARKERACAAPGTAAPATSTTNFKPVATSNAATPAKPRTTLADLNLRAKNARLTAAAGKAAVLQPVAKPAAVKPVAKPAKVVKPRV